MSECSHCEHYHELLQIVNHLQNEIKELKESYQKRIDDLERRLSYYENAHSPPSRESLYWRQQKKERRTAPPSKPGQKLGHTGATHNLKPTQTIRHTASRCRRCGSTNITEATQNSRIIVEVPRPQPCTVTRHIIQSYICRNCGSTTDADADIPHKGFLGRNLVAAIVSLWAARLPIRKISRTIESFYNFRLTAACISNCLYNVSESVEPFVERTRREICSSDTAHFDETPYPVNGDSGWVWVATNRHSCLVMVEWDRGKSVLKRHFGSFAGVAVTDGWRAYSKFGTRQRCWAHIIREAKHLSQRTGSELAALLHGELLHILLDAKSGLEENPAPNHILHQSISSRLDGVISRYRTDKHLQRFAAKLDNAKDQLLTFLLYPGVLPTNNAAEQALRESVIHRKIRGLVRNEKGMKMFGNLMTCIMTWNMHRCNILDEIVKYL